MRGSAAGRHLKENFLKSYIAAVSLYFTHLPRIPQWTDLHGILHMWSCSGCNHLFQILCRSVEGFRICAGSNFAILHWLSRLPLTQYRAPVITTSQRDVINETTVQWLYNLIIVLVFSCHVSLLRSRAGFRRGGGPQASHQHGVSHQTPQFLKPRIR